MKKLLSTLPLLLLVSQINAQSAKYSWNTTIGGNGNEQANAVVTDPMGNVYTVGKFSGTVDFDPGPGIFSITAFGSTDAYITKQSPSGSFFWAKHFGGGGEDESISVVLDPLDNIYITGNYTGLGDFDPGLPGGSIASSGPKDIFMVKLDRNGMFQWVRSMGTIIPDGNTSCTWDKMGYIYSTGTYWTMDGLADIYIHKMDPNGIGIWLRTFGGFDMDLGNDISTDRFGNIYVIGNFTGAGDFNPSSATTKLTSNGLKDIFIAKFNSLGTQLWIKQIGGEGDDLGSSIHVNDSGNIYITGSFSGRVDMNPSALEDDTSFVLAQGSNDMFLSKLDLSGNFLWVRTVGKEDAECAGLSVKSDIIGNVVVSGVFTDTINFDPRPTKMYPLSSAGQKDVFITKYDKTGNFIWAKQYGGIYNDSSLNMEIDMASNIITVGSFQDTVDFDPAKAVRNNWSNGGNDIFVHKLAYCTPTYLTINDTLCRPLTLEGITYDKSGIYYQTITGAGGCEEFVTLDIDVRTFNDTISKSGVVLTSHANGLKYQWIECTSKKEIPGATGKSYIALGNNKYAVTLFDGRCRDTSDCIEISSFTASMEEYALQNSVQIFPNPTNGEFNIAVNENMLGAKATIYNLLGQKVREVELIQINTKQSLNQGFYILEISKEQKHFTKKLLVE